MKPNRVAFSGSVEWPTRTRRRANGVIVIVVTVVLVLSIDVTALAEVLSAIAASSR